MTVRTIIHEPPPAEAVRSIACPLCAAAPGWSCGLSGSHLARWLRAFAFGLVSRADLVAAVGGLVVVSAAQLVPECAA